MSKPTGSTLPPKELSLFKRIVKCYEHKQYKHGLKFARQILSNPKFVEHGETLAMKGLILNCLGKKEEAYDLVRKGLRSDLKSSICWHVFGLLQKSDRKYDEAIKCYLQALRLDKENMQILRDLSLLQMQMRNLEGYKDTRYQLLILRPSQKASWVGYAIALHLLENFDTALNVLEEFRKAQQNIRPYDYEHSELLLYQAWVMLEAGRLPEALEHLSAHGTEIVDHLALLEIKGELLLKLSRLEEARTVFWELIDRNPENKRYYQLLEEASRDLAVSGEPVSGAGARYEVYVEASRRYPKAALPRRLPLNFLTDEEFRRSADAYLRPSLRKGIPPLFIQLAPLYTDPSKVAILDSLYQSYLNNLAEHGRLGPLGEPDEEMNGGEDEAGPDSTEPPSTGIWVNYLVAQHYNFLGRCQEALALVDTQLEHTPTLIEFYSLKGQIYRDAGDILTGSYWLEEAQSLDTADRYINSLCTRYLVQAGRLTDATDMAAKFTREGTPASDHLTEMQCMWFLTECAKAQQALGKYGEALKRCHEVERHFTAMLEDQFDFHSYCLRKMTLRAYVEMLRLEDRLRSHPFFFEAARVAVEIYLHLHDHPLGEDDALNDGESKDLPPSELKKLRNKQRKAQRKAESEAARARMEQERREQAQRSRQNAPGGSNASSDKDQEGDRASEERLDPAKLARPEKPLDEAIKFIHYLLELSPHRIETHCLAYEIYEKKDRPLLMLRAIKRGALLPGSADHPWFHACRARFLLVLAGNKQDEGTGQSLPAPVRAVLDTELANCPALLCASGDAKLNLATVSKINDAFIARNAHSLQHVVRGLVICYKIDPACQAACLQRIVQLDSSFTGVTWQACAEVLANLKSGALGPIDPVLINSYRTACHQKFPMATVFFTEHQMANLRASLAATVSPSNNGPAVAVDNSNGQEREAEVNGLLSDELTCHCALDQTGGVEALATAAVA